jgi:Kef-type K+ transport system membrane component KefB
METGSVLLELFVVFAAAKVVGELFEHVRLPAVVGELLAGMVVGPHVLGWIDGDGPALAAFAELGVIILLFRAGLETSIRDLRHVGLAAFAVALLGDVLAFAAGFGVMLAFGFGTEISLLGAAALVATSVGIAARVLTDRGITDTPVGRVTLAAAVIDDIISIVAVTVIVGLVDGQGSAVEIATAILEVLAFLAIVVFAGPRLTRGLFRILHWPGIPESPFLAAVLLTLGLAAVSEIVGLAAVIGAFLAGLIVELRREEVAAQVAPVADLLVPFFFAVAGSRLDPAALTDPSILALAGSLLLAAIVTKVAGGMAGARGLGRRDALAVGVGMVPRGEVTLIVAGLGVGLGLFSPGLYAALVSLTIVTSLLSALLLGRLAGGRRATSGSV